MSFCKTNNVIKKEKLLLKRNHRLTNIRKNYLNQTISEIVNRKPRFICIEDLNVRGMMKNRHLSKAVQEQGFFGFRKQLEYKCNDKGIQLIVADRFYPSSKLCSCCGNIKEDLKLSDRVYRCECGNMIDRDFQKWWTGSIIHFPVLQFKWPILPRKPLPMSNEII